MSPLACLRNDPGHRNRGAVSQTSRQEVIGIIMWPMNLVWLSRYYLFYMQISAIILPFLGQACTGWLRIKYPIRQYAISPQPVV